MNWSIRLALLSSVVFSTQIIFGEEQVATPWESTQLTDNFIASFLRAISRSSTFSSSQLDEMSTIRKTLIEAMETFNSSNMSSKTKNQALNMVFASAMAEITAAEQEGVSIESKTKEIENALSSAFQEATGIENTQFVGDIKNLINTLAYTKATGVSTASVVKVGDNKQGSLGLLDPSTSATAMSVSGSAPQQGLEKKQQGPSVEQSSRVLNVTGGYRSALPSVTRLQGPPFQTPTEQHARGSKVALGTQNSQGLTAFGPISSPQVPSVKDQLGPGGYGTAIAIAGATGEGLRPSVQSSPRSEVNGLGQQSLGDYDQIGQESSSREKFLLVSQGPTGNGLAASGSYGEDSVTVGLQGPPGIGGKVSGTQEPSKTVEKGPGNYEARAQVSAALDEKGPGSGATGPLVEGSSAYREQEHGTQRIPVAVGQRTEVYEPGNYGWGAAASKSEAVGSSRPTTSTVESQVSQEPTGKGTEGSSSYGLRAGATAVAGIYVPGTGTGRVQQEVQGPSRTGNQDEKGIQGQIPSGQRPANQGQFETRYLETGRFGGQDPGGYTPGADATASAAVKVSRGQAPLGQRSSEVGGQGLGSLKLSEAESQSVSNGLNDYGRSSAAAVASAASDYKSSSGVKGLQELISKGSASDGRNGYASGSATANARPAGGSSPVGPLIASRLSTPEGSSKVSSTASSLVSSNPTKPSVISNAVNSIVSQVGRANPDLAYCNVLIQTMLEIVADLVHLLGYCN